VSTPPRPSTIAIEMPAGRRARCSLSQECFFAGRLALVLARVRSLVLLKESFLRRNDSCLERRAMGEVMMANAFRFGWQWPFCAWRRTNLPSCKLGFESFETLVVNAPSPADSITFDVSCIASWAVKSGHGQAPQSNHVAVFVESVTALFFAFEHGAADLGFGRL